MKNNCFVKYMIDKVRVSLTVKGLLHIDGLLHIRNG